MKIALFAFLLVFSSALLEDDLYSEFSCEPKRVISEILRRPGYYGEKNVLKLAWLTEGNCTQMLKYGIRQNELTSIHKAKTAPLMHSVGHTTSSLPTGEHLIFSHSVILDNLEMDQHYFFKVGNSRDISKKEYR